MRDPVFQFLVETNLSITKPDFTGPVSDEINGFVIVSSSGVSERNLLRVGGGGHKEVPTRSFCLGVSLGKNHQSSPSSVFINDFSHRSKI